MNWRSKPYLKAVASLPCAICGLEGYTQAAHANTPPFGKGRGIKAHDWATIPLCADSPAGIGCHTRHDQYMSEKSKSERIDSETQLILGTMSYLLVTGAIGVTHGA